MRRGLAGAYATAMLRMTAAAPQQSAGRLHWLDVTRVLCALMDSSAFTCCAPAFASASSVAGDPVNLVMDYQSHNGGLQLFNYVLIAGHVLARPASPG